MIIDKIVVWRLEDGNINTTFLYEEARLSGESNEDFIDREVKRLIKLNPNLSNIKYFIKSKLEWNSIVSTANKRAVRIDTNGNFYIDRNYKSPQEVISEKKAIVRNKLKLGQVLNDDDVDLILGK